MRRIGDDGTDPMLSDLEGDLLALGEIDCAKFGAIVRAFEMMPVQAGPALWAMPLELRELRGIVTAGILATADRPEIIEYAVALLPLVDRAGNRSRLRGALGDEDLEARSLLWALAVAWTLPPAEDPADDA